MDHNLTSAEVLRLAALGFIIERPRNYAIIAAEIRDFTTRLVGPSLDLLGNSLELLRLEGLVTQDDQHNLSITTEGQDRFYQLIASPIIPPFNDLIIVTLELKLRLLHLVSNHDQQAIATALVDSFHLRKDQILSLNMQHKSAIYSPWLDHLMTQIQDTIDFIETTFPKSN